MISTAWRILNLTAILLASMILPPRSNAAGVTIITHGYDADVKGWVTAMADSIPPYFSTLYFGLSPNCSVYTLKLTTDGSQDYYEWSTNAAAPPLNTDTGEIIIKLDWSQMAGSPDPLSTAADVSTYEVARMGNGFMARTTAS